VVGRGGSAPASAPWGGALHSVPAFARRFMRSPEGRARGGHFSAAHRAAAARFGFNASGLAAPLPAPLPATFAALHLEPPAASERGWFRTDAALRRLLACRLPVLALSPDTGPAPALPDPPCPPRAARPAPAERFGRRAGAPVSGALPRAAGAAVRERQPSEPGSSGGGGAARPRAAAPRGGRGAGGSPRCALEPFARPRSLDVRPRLLCRPLDPGRVAQRRANRAGCLEKGPGGRGGGRC
jgi:hypothetical protein